MVQNPIPKEGPMKKRLLSLFCVFAIALCTLPARALEGDRQRAAESLAAIGLLHTSDDYRLDAGATRLEALTVLSRITGADRGDCPYTDVPGWAQGAVGAVHAAGALQGIYDGTALNGQEYVTADEWCAMLLHLVGKPTAPDGAARYAQRLGMISRNCGSPLTRGELFELTREALGYCTEEGVSLAAQMAEKGLCTAETLEVLRICPTALTAREAADRHMAAVACLQVYKSQKDFISNIPSADASAFFITGDGVAVTNYHAIEDAAVAEATLTTGEKYPVEGVLWADEAADLAVIKISRLQSGHIVSTPSFATLTMVGSDEVLPGDVVYALGNPLGLGHSVSAGIVSAVGSKSALSSHACITTTAPISSGSSGGALLNEYGHVLAVTTGAYTDGNSMFLSVPVDTLLNLDLSAAQVVPLDKLDTLSK